VYVTSTRFPTEKAHGLATVKLCEAFARRGYAVDVLAPRLWRRDGGDVFDYYDVKNTFRIVKIPCIDLIPLRVIDTLAFLLQSISFSLLALLYVASVYRAKMKKCIFFSHDYIPLYFMTFLPVSIFYDVHHFPGNNFMYRRVVKRAFGFAVQTKWKVNELSDKFGIAPERIVYWPNGTDIRAFDDLPTKNTTRKELSLPTDKKIIMYTGQLFEWKGVDSLLRSITMLPSDAVLYIVGGADSDVVRCKKEIPEANDARIVFIPFQSHEKIPVWLNSADVLVLPNTGKQKVSLYYTSPMKLFEYMASGRPIVASAIPSLQEILNDRNAVLVEPDNPEALAAGIRSVLDDAATAEKISRNAKIDSREYTWDGRTQRIGAYFEKYA
jgi:glycosyltransferase involved in cell wall biosynthesis